jgi:hypothetical protein
MTLLGARRAFFRLAADGNDDFAARARQRSPQLDSRSGSRGQAAPLTRDGPAAIRPRGRTEREH